MTIDINSYNILLLIRDMFSIHREGLSNTWSYIGSIKTKQKLLILNFLEEYSKIAPSKFSIMIFLRGHCFKLFNLSGES